MSTTRAKSLIVNVARKLKDLRATAGADSDTGRRYTSAVLTNYLNRAIRDLIRSVYDADRTGFGAMLPEYVGTTTTFTISGLVAKQPEQWHFLELTTSDGLISFYPLLSDVMKVIGLQDRLIRPSYSRPVFWEEAGCLFVYPTTKNGTDPWSVKGRYVKAHQNITVDTSPTDAGNWSTGTGGYTAATKTLVITMATNFASTDVNKRIFFRSATNVYAGMIDTKVANNTVTLRGDGLPAGDVASPGVIDAIVSSLSADTNDLPLNTEWDGELEDRMFKLALTDSVINQPDKVAP
jgi:hypothetical protein